MATARRTGELEREDYVLSSEEYERLLEERVRFYLGMSLADFREALKRGDLAEDSAAVTYLRLLAEGHRR